MQSNGNEEEALASKSPLSWLQERQEQEQKIKVPLVFVTGDHKNNCSEETSNKTHDGKSYENIKGLSSKETDNDDNKTPNSTPNVKPTTSTSSLPSEPLSWRIARSKMTKLLQNYLNDSNANHEQQLQATNNKNEIEYKWCALFSWLTRRDLDVYLGSILFSIILLIMSIRSFFIARGENHKKEEDDINQIQNPNSTGSGSSIEDYQHDNFSAMHKSYMIASIIFVLTSIFSMWVMKCRRTTSIRDVYWKRRKNVRLLLHLLDSLEHAHEIEEDRPQSQLDNATTTSKLYAQLPGNALSDIYLVYRTSSTTTKATTSSRKAKTTSGKITQTSQERVKGSWHKIPSLLLVPGDFIALQTGDVAPADCKIAVGSRFGSSRKIQKITSCSSLSSLSQQQNNLPSRDVNGMEASSTTASQQLFHSNFSGDISNVKAGDVIQALSKCVRSDHQQQQQQQQQQRHRNQSASLEFPPGKSTLPEYSRKLLHLCNNKRVFEVLEAPICAFLKSKPRSYQSPREHRKLEEVRNTLFLLGIFEFIVSLVIVTTRHEIRGTDHFHQYYLPFLTALSVLPIITPIVLFLLEIIGTARVLQYVHTLLKNTSEEDNNPLVKDLVSSSNSLYLFLRYFWFGCKARFRLTHDALDDNGLIPFPPISHCFFEKLGLITASAFIDDELICDPIPTPELLLLPSNNGLKLLDMFPKYDEIDDESTNNIGDMSRFRNQKGTKYNRRLLASASDDSDSDWDEEEVNTPAIPWRKRKSLAALSKKHRKRNFSESFHGHMKDAKDVKNEIQFEDPAWWRYLPSLKCIGLSCILLDQYKSNEKEKEERTLNKIALKSSNNTYLDNRFRHFHGQAESALVNEVCHRMKRPHLQLLSECIGFTTNPSILGKNGDVSSFQEIKRIHVIATRLLQEQAALGRHEIGLQQSRAWGMLQPDSTSIVIRDNRSLAYQLLTVGDARVVTDFCSDSWQGGISTITPLTTSDRAEIIESGKNWALSDLDVTAFSYCPISCSHEQKFGHSSEEVYLVDNRLTEESPVVNHSEEWGVLKNQIFLGLLGSSVNPRKYIAQLIEEYENAGVRFVYFSARNMRRTKEVASEMGIDVSWNSAISLHPLDEKEDHEYHKNKYGEDDFNARLPHGVEAVVRHLEDVDNVPLLVRLYTNATKGSTNDMIQIFHENSDTVLTVGLAHASHNNEIFTTSSVAIGINVLFGNEELVPQSDSIHESSDLNKARLYTHRLSPKEVAIISSISSDSCAFNLPLEYGLDNLSSLLSLGRTVLNGGHSAAAFMLVSYLSFSFLVLMVPFSACLSLPYIPGVGSTLHLLVIIPSLGISMGFVKIDSNLMNIVPAKNNADESFSRGERQKMLICVFIKALIPAVLGQIMYLIAFGSLVIELDPDFVVNECGFNTFSWVNIIRCQSLKSYSGRAIMPSGVLMITYHALCLVGMSASFLLGSSPVLSKGTLKNKVWIFATILIVAIVILYMSITLESGVMQILPWYFYLLSLVSPFICLAVCEIVKMKEMRFEERAIKMRRLHFETRLGMWSPR